MNYIFGLGIDPDVGSNIYWHNYCIFIVKVVGMSGTHIPVLSNEVIEFLNPTPNGIYVDATIGLGGHAGSILDQSFPTGRLIGIDLDTSALTIAEERLQDYNDRVTFVHGNYRDIQQLLGRYEINEVDGILMDLGVSSLQLDTPERGFSFQKLACLDMRMDPTIKVSATQIINESTPDKLIQILQEFGEERYTKRIVREIVKTRAEKPITTTLQLAELVKKVYPSNVKRTKSTSKNGHKRNSIHPATRVFQALRIEVNSELDNLSMGIDAAVSVLKPGGCLCIIDFHSLEDRIVKRKFKKLGKDCVCPPKIPICICEHKKQLRILTNRPIIPSEDEIEGNPRARSAKLRAGRKV